MWCWAGVSAAPACGQDSRFLSWHIRPSVCDLSFTAFNLCVWCELMSWWSKIRISSACQLFTVKSLEIPCLGAWGQPLLE